MDTGGSPRGSRKRKKRPRVGLPFVSGQFQTAVIAGSGKVKGRLARLLRRLQTGLHAKGPPCGKDTRAACIRRGHPRCDGWLDKQQRSAGARELKDSASLHRPPRNARRLADQPASLLLWETRKAGTVLPRRPMRDRRWRTSCCGLSARRSNLPLPGTRQIRGEWHKGATIHVLYRFRADAPPPRRRTSAQHGSTARAPHGHPNGTAPTHAHKEYKQTPPTETDAVA